MRTCMAIFFMKQDTAYEVRISDWSSDVCSSDLQSYLRSPAWAPKLDLPSRLHQKAVRADAGLARIADFGRHRAVDRRVHVRIVENEKRSIAAQFQADPLDGRHALRGEHLEIGRAHV